MQYDICHSTQHFRRECPRGDGGGRGPSMHLTQTDSDKQYLSASMSLDNYAGELFEEIYIGHSEINLAD
eukprot:1401482-Pyramimonas_sp.AAC.1